jgi:hypothetical protein
MSWTVNLRSLNSFVECVSSSVERAGLRTYTREINGNVPIAASDVDDFLIGKIFPIIVVPQDCEAIVDCDCCQLESLTLHRKLHTCAPTPHRVTEPFASFFMLRMVLVEVLLELSIEGTVFDARIVRTGFDPFVHVARCFETDVELFLRHGTV